MLYDFIVIHFAPLTGLLFLMIFLLSNLKTDKRIHHVFAVVFGLELLELVVYSAELWTASFAEPSVLRILFSAIGYSVRPFLVLCILQMIGRYSLQDKRIFLWSIPAYVNVVLAFSAFFTDIAYSYNGQNQFVRGPLGYFSQVTILFYLIVILVFSIRRGEKNNLESTVVWAIDVVVVLAMVLEAVFNVRSLGRTAIVLSTLAYYLFFQSLTYKEDIKKYMEQTIATQKEHLREMSIIGVLANEYVTVCYVDVEKNLVTPYRMDPAIAAQYGETFRKGVSFEQIFTTYVMQDIVEEDRDFFLNVDELPEMISYLHQHGSISRKYRVLREGNVLYCEMRAELVHTESGTEDIVFGFSNNDTRVRREMIYQSTVQQEMDKVEEAKRSLADIAQLTRQLQEAIGDKFTDFIF